MERDYAALKEFVLWAREQGITHLSMGDVSVIFGTKLQVAEARDATHATPQQDRSNVVDLHRIVQQRAQEEEATGLPEFQDPDKLLDRLEGKPESAAVSGDEAMTGGGE